MMHKNPSFTTSHDVKAICDEYFRDSHLHYFGHGVLFANGEHYCSNTDAEWAKWHLLEQNLPPAGLTTFNQMQNAIKLPHLKSGDELGWSPDAMRFAKERFGIENLMIIFRKFDDRLESFFFDLHDTNAHEYYLNHFDIFENFIFYFKEKAKHFLQLAANNPLLARKEYLNSDVMSLNLDQENLRKNLKPTQFMLAQGNQISVLSAREYECLTQLAHGRKIKEIAETLFISPRTVETHLVHIKHKLNTRNLSTAVKIYWDNRVLKRC